MNFDASPIGVPFLRVYQINIAYPDNKQIPVAYVQQGMAVQLADGSIRKIEEIETLTINLDLASDGKKPVPLVNPNTGAYLGASTTLNNVMLQIFAVVRQSQALAYPQPAPAPSPAPAPVV